MTKKLINRTIVLIIISIVIFKFIPSYQNTYFAFRDKENGMVSQYDKEHYPATHKDKIVSEYMGKYDEDFFIIMTLMLVVVCFFFGGWLVHDYVKGEYDNFFEKYTDPKLQQFCNWVNRRNKTEC